ncbi:Spore photoproduct lyase [Clostridiales bacterium PH28_bin88]|nr:Spore photoproduct lyase [Clostridiales bacterium PH28_bin88]
MNLGPYGRKYGGNEVVELFVPKRVIFEPAALDYPLGRHLLVLFREKQVEIGYTSSHNRVTGIQARTRQQGFREAKRTLVVGVRRGRTFQTCRPSAHFQIPIATSCPGMCEYCYLMTNLGQKPYLRVYVNIDEILDTAAKYIKERLPEQTVFEGSATSDPVPVEPYTGSLARIISFFAGQEAARFRFVTKFTEVDSLLGLEHRGHTRFRFSVNAEEVIVEHEHGTPGLDDRLEAAGKVAQAGYPLGFLVAPVLAGNGWRQEYQRLFEKLGRFCPHPDLTFEFVTHRFTRRAKDTILELFPETSLPMDEESRTFKFGQFGYGKYVYPKETLNELESFFREQVASRFPGAKFEYFV